MLNELDCGSDFAICEVITLYTLNLFWYQLRFNKMKKKIEWKKCAAVDNTRLNIVVLGLLLLWPQS